MDFRELHLGTQLDEEVHSGKRAFFEDSDDEQEEFSVNNSIAREKYSSRKEEPASSVQSITNNTTSLETESKSTEVTTGLDTADIPVDTATIISEEVIEDAGEFDINDIEGLPYSRQGGRPIRHKEKKEPLYGTTAVGQMLGLSTQAIRNYCDFFEDYLQIQRKEGGHRSFTYDDIERLRQLINIKDEKNFTFKQLKEYLEGPENFNVIPEAQRFETAIEKMEQVFEMSLKNAISYVVESNSKLLEQKDEETKKMVNGVAEQLKCQDAAISELLEIIKDRQSSTEDELNKTIEKLQDSLKERDKKITELVMMTEQQSARITELETKKQKKFLGLF